VALASGTRRFLGRCITARATTPTAESPASSANASPTVST
jgi:hypothetical protein